MHGSRPTPSLHISSEVNILNSHNSVIFQARRLKFCMVVHIGNTNKLYHAIPYHNYQNIPNYTNSHNSVIFQARSPKFYMVVYLHNTNRPNHAILHPLKASSETPRHLLYNQQKINKLSLHYTILYQIF